ncbi:MAG: hypothetical protein ABEK17_04685 [Candidatus Aenigmatarchaeota archaeon]
MENCFRLIKGGVTEKPFFWVMAVLLIIIFLVVSLQAIGTAGWKLPVETASNVFTQN